MLHKMCYKCLLVLKDLLSELCVVHTPDPLSLKDT